MRAEKAGEKEGRLTVGILILPATLLLRPFNFNTLATRVYEKASLEQIGNASPAAMLVIAVGLCAVQLLAHANRPAR